MILKFIGLILVGLLVLGAFLTFFQQADRNAIQKEEVFAPGVVPEIIFRRFLTASLSGDEKTVNEISSFPEQDWLRDCRGESTNDGLDSSAATFSKLAESNVMAPSSEIGAPKIGFRGTNITDDIRQFARFVYVAKIQNDRFRIVEQRQFKDEALLVVEFSDSQKNFSKSQRMDVAFLRRNGVWKLVGIIENGGQFDLIHKDVKYGTDRPTCSF